jgi:hypothetical protein
MKKIILIFVMLLFASPCFAASNLLTDGGFEIWTNSTTLTNWALAGLGGSLAQETTLKVEGTYSAKVTRAGANTTIGQDLQNSGGHNLLYWQGRTVTFGVWVYSAAANVTIRINDGISQTDTAHPGDSQWHFLTVTKTLSALATSVTCQCRVFVNGSAYFDNATFVDYPYIPSASGFFRMIK